MPEYTSGRITRVTEAKVDRAKTVPLEKAVNRGQIGPPPRVNPMPTPARGSQSTPPPAPAPQTTHPQR